MSNYSKSTNFATKDNLTPGDPLKIVRGTEIDTEFNNIATAIATKTDNASAAITGGTINDTTIGATTASTGAFTTLAASGNVTLSGGTANGVTYLNGSKVVTSGSALTFNGTSLGIGSSSYGDAGTITASIGVAGTTAGGLQLWASSAQEHYIQWGDSTTGSATYAGAISYSHASDFMRFWTNSTEQMRLTSTGLGIGTSSPSYKLDVRGVLGSGNGTITSGFSYDTGGLVGTFSNHALGVLTNGNVVAKFDTSGNLGLGVTPSAWAAAKAYQVGGYAAYGQRTVGTSDLSMSWNATITSGTNSGTGYVYRNSGDLASAYEQNGAHRWYIAPSGTAGNAITFTQAMTLDASGNLMVGTTSAVGRFTLENAATTTEITLRSTGGVGINNRARIIGGYEAGGSDYGGYLAFNTTSTSNVNGERARIDSSGNLRIGTTSHLLAFNRRLTVYGDAGIEAVVTGTGGEPCVEMWQQHTSGNNVFSMFYTEGTATARGSITYNRAGGLVAYNTTSDYRAKDISGPVTNSGALIDSTPVYMGKMKGATQERPMFIAHETPDYAHTGEKDAVDADGNPVYQQMDASALIPVMWAEIQSLRKRLADAGI